MGKSKSKLYGRKNPNKLDWLLAWVFVTAAVAALWMMIGVIVKDAALYASVAFEDVVKSLAFSTDVNYLGSAVVIVILGTVIIYGSLILLVCGIVALCKKNQKERIPGLVAAFCSAIFFVIFLAFTFEFMGGVGYNSIPLVFPIILILFLVCFAYYMVRGTVMALGNCNIERGEKQPEPEYYDEVEDFIAQPEEEQEEVKEEPKEEPQPQEEPEEEMVEEEKEVAEDEESDEFSFDDLGKRRKRIPFEKKIKRSTSDTRTRYQMIVSELRKYDFNDRTSIPGETFSYKREKLIFITFSGNTLKVHFRLNPKEFEDSPLPIKDASDVKRFEDVPAFIKIKSDLAARRAVALGERVAEENSVPKK